MKLEVKFIAQSKNEITPVYLLRVRSFAAIYQQLLRINLIVGSYSIAAYKKFLGFFRS